MKSNENLIVTKIGEKIRYYRKLNGCTLKELAKLLGVSAQQLQKYESGANRITSEKLTRIATHLNIPVGLFFEDDFKTYNFDKQLKMLINNFNKIKSKKVRKLLIDNSEVFCLTK